MTQDNSGVNMTPSVEDMVAEADTGARNPSGMAGKMLILVPLAWSFFQIYISSNVPFWLTKVLGVNLTFNSDEARAIHLAFALFLAATAFPLFKTSPRRSIPW